MTDRAAIGAIRRGRGTAWDGRSVTVFTPPDHAWELDLIEQGEKGAWALWANAAGRRRPGRGSKRTTKATTRRTGSRSERRAPTATESAYARVYRRALARRAGGGRVVDVTDTARTKPVDQRKPHLWEQGDIVNAAPTLRCGWCGRVWMPDESLDRQGECPKFGRAEG